MALISKSVNKTLVNGSEIFVYTVNAAFSDLTQTANEGKIIDVLPSKIKYILPPVGGQIQSITTTPVPGGTQISFNLGSVNAGTSLSFTFACSFGPGRTDNDSFTNQMNLVADGVVVAQATAPTVYLNLNENFVLQKLARPSNVVNPGDQITLVLALINSGDPGAAITNINITDVLPPQLIPVITSAPVGNDVPSGGYSDPSYNGLTGSWNGNAMTFNLPSYHGARYEVTFQATVASDVTPGQTFVNTGNLTVNGAARSNASLTLSAYNPSTDTFNLSKAGPRTAALGGPISYNFSNSNVSGVDISNYVLEDSIPDEVDITGLRLAGGTGLVNCNIYIALASDPSVYIPIAQNISGGVYPFTDLTPFIPAGDRIEKIKLTAQILMSTGSAHSFYINGTLNSTAASGATIINSLNASSGTTSNTATVGSIVNGASDLYVSKSITPSKSAYYPLDEFSVTIQGNCLNTLTVEPILMDLMPVGLRYVTDSEYFQYYDYVANVTYDSRQPNFPVPLPVRDVIPNFADTGDTLLRWPFANFILPYGCNLRVVFTAFVEVSPPSSFINQAYEGMPGNNVMFVYYEVDDPLDLDGDGLTTTDKLSTASVSGVILSSSEFSLTKLVQGEMDLAFSSAGTTGQGGDVDYRLQVTNNQPINIRDIEIVDILPFVGDRGVILTTQARGSQFNVYATSDVTAEIVNLIGEPVDPNPDISIEYSTSNDPERFDQLGNPIGTGSWSLTPPIDVTTIRSVRVTTGSSVILRPYDRLNVYIGAKAPVGVPTGYTAYNSYAVRVNKIISDQLVPLLPTEPNKVSVKSAAAQLNAIGSFVWNDLNRNGLYDVGEPGVNGVVVELYSDTGILLSSTVTSNDVNGNPGYYLFTGLADGVYQVKFLTPDGFALTQQQSIQTNGSRPNPDTGLSPFITITNNQQILDINAGIINSLCPLPIIHASDSCICVGGTFDPMKGVYATDCQGVDITSSVVVTENNVDTSTPGLYLVSYSVTDHWGQPNTETIFVTVRPKDPRQQAITDIIESIALEQTAISHIMNAEGEKLQKAVSLELTTGEMLKINRSVKKTLNAVARLEMVLLGKIELFDVSKGSSDCCK